MPEPKPLGEQHIEALRRMANDGCVAYLSSSDCAEIVKVFDADRARIAERDRTIAEMDDLLLARTNEREDALCRIAAALEVCGRWKGYGLPDDAFPDALCAALQPQKGKP
jgi:hypothetical protein